MSIWPGGEFKDTPMGRLTPEERERLRLSGGQPFQRPDGTWVSIHGNKWDGDTGKQVGEL